MQLPGLRAGGSGDLPTEAAQHPGAHSHLPGYTGLQLKWTDTRQRQGFQLSRHFSGQPSCNRYLCLRWFRPARSDQTTPLLRLKSSKDPHLMQTKMQSPDMACPALSIIWLLSTL